MSGPVSVYTLLIVESPTLAGIIQQKAPSSVFVLATGGFCWRPSYDSKTGTLKAVADPQKKDLRKELKNQAKFAGNIIIATDPDPSGDFIAWSVKNYLNSSLVKRGQIQSLSRSGIINSINNTFELDDKQLEVRLKNRFVILNEWNNHKSLPAYSDALLASFFSNKVPFSHFLDENGAEFYSSEKLRLEGDEWIPVRRNSSLQEHINSKPLSTYNCIEKMMRLKLSASFSDAQLMLQQLFQTSLHTSEDSVISYPRSRANAFYSSTWDQLRDQYIKIGSQSDLKPRFLQEIAGPEEPHESIHPLQLSESPELVAQELPDKLGKLYRLIYKHTIRAIKLPEPVAVPLISDFTPDYFFYSGHNSKEVESESLRPFRSVSELGDHMNMMGGVSPSKFGQQMDEWIQQKWIKVDDNRVIPGEKLLPQLEKSEYYLNLFNELLRLDPFTETTPETVRRLITS